MGKVKSKLSTFSVASDVLARKKEADRAEEHVRWLLAGAEEGFPPDVGAGPSVPEVYVMSYDDEGFARYASAMRRYAERGHLPPSALETRMCTDGTCRAVVLRCGFTTLTLTRHEYAYYSVTRATATELGDEWASDEDGDEDGE